MTTNGNGDPVVATRLGQDMRSLTDQLDHTPPEVFVKYASVFTEGQRLMEALEGLLATAEEQRSLDDG